MKQAPAGATAQPGPRSRADRRPRRWQALALRYLPAGAAAAVMTILGLWGLVRQDSMGNDEVATRYAAVLSLGQLARLLRHVDAVHGTYYLFMHAWVVAVGSSPPVLRVPSLIAMAAGAALAAFITTRLTGSGWAGLLAGLILALIPSISYYAQTARSYAMVLAGVTAATLVLTRALQAEAQAGARTRWWWAGYGALMTVSAYLNEMALLVLAAHLVTVLLARGHRRALGHFLVTAVICGVLAAPLVLLSLGQRSAVEWITRPGLSAVQVLFHDYFGTTAGSVIIFLFAVAAVLPPRGWRWRGWRSRIRHGARPDDPGAAWWERRGVSVQSAALPLLVLPAGLLIAESLVAHPLYVDRYVLYGAAGAAMLAGAGCYRTGQWLARQARPVLASPAARRMLTVIPGVAACLCILVVNAGAQHSNRLPQRSQFDFGSASAFVGARARSGDGILYLNTFFRKARYGYPGDFADTTDFALARTPQQAGSFNGVNKPYSEVAPLLAQFQRIWTFGRRPSPRLPTAQLRAEARLLRSNYQLAAKQSFTGITVMLWTRQ